MVLLLTVTSILVTATQGFWLGFRPPNGVAHTGEYGLLGFRV